MLIYVNRDSNKCSSLFIDVNSGCYLLIVVNRGQ
jgi:hypothetical protein